jgi:transposase
MEHVAIDLGARKSRICVRDSNGEILEEKDWPTRELGAYLEKRPKSRVIVETCAEGFFVADRARELAHEIRVVPATLVHTLGVGARKTKTDKRDARVLSEVSCRIDLPSVHIPSEKARELKSILKMREGLLTSRTKLINNLRGYFRAQAIEVPVSKKAFLESIDPLLQQMTADNVTTSCVRRHLRMVKELTKEIKEADKEVELLAKQDPVCPRLMTAPGVGPITALQFVASVDDVSRFKSSHDLQAYFGLTPGEHSSSDKQRRTGITKAGAPAMRKYLVQAAWGARRTKARHSLHDWMGRIELRRGKMIAVVALARKLAGILFALWRDNTTYNANLSARPLSQ